MSEMGVLGQGLERYATEFIERTRQLKSLVLLRTSEPSEDTGKLLEELEAALVKAERTMNQLKCKIAEECRAVRMAEAIVEKSKLQTKHLDYIKRNAPESVRRRMAEVQRKEEFSKEAGAHHNAGQRHVHDSNNSNKENSQTNATERSRPKVAIAPISAEEMNSVPGYLKGRLQSHDKVNDAIVEINGLLSSRAALLSQTLSKLSDQQMKQVQAWKDLDVMAEHSKGGCIALYEADLKGTSLKVGESSSREIINVLKHLQRLKDSRGPAGDKVYICACT